jgi:hypothetical protein
MMQSAFVAAMRFLAKDIPLLRGAKSENFFHTLPLQSTRERTRAGFSHLALVYLVTTDEGMQALTLAANRM